jgi:hypothetical protein
MELDQVNDALEGCSWAIALGYLVQPALKAFRVAVHEAGCPPSAPMAQN